MFVLNYQNLILEHPPTPFGSAAIEHETIAVNYGLMN